MEITELYDLAEDFEQTAFTITDDGFADWAIEVIAEGTGGSRKNEKAQRQSGLNDRATG